jgi:hypothetical protein
VPTPFYHLHLAETLLRNRTLPRRIKNLLLSQKPAFLLGTIGPDVQVISGQTRIETHFYKLPISNNQALPWEWFQTQVIKFDILADLPPPTQAFYAGYMCHLMADWFWTVQIFEPVFSHQANWQTLPRRLYLHNILRSYLDLQIISEMERNIRCDLHDARISGWLPFVRDQHLQTWRDFIVCQLQPETKIQTVEIFASRQNLDPAEFYRLLHSETALDAELFSIFPRREISHFWEQLLVKTNAFLQETL